jgi:hypothetical protein
MSRTIRILRVVTFIVAGTAPLLVQSQQAGAGTNFDTTMPNFGTLAQSAKPVVADPFQRPSVSPRKAEDADASGSLLIHLDHKWTTALAQYDFAAPPVFYAFEHNASGASDWDSVLSGSVMTYVNRSNTTYLRMSSDFEMQGQKREAGAIGEPGAQTLTLEWELARLLTTRLGVMEVATGRYQQQLTSYAAFANSPLLNPFLGYSGSAAGFETSITLPDKNLTFTFRQGTEHANAGTRSRAMQFLLSWTW